MPIIDVGKIPAGLLHDEWETQVIRFHGFEGLPAERNVPAESPTFICFGHEWRLWVYPGGISTSDDGMVSLYLQNLSNTNTSITIQYGFSVKNKIGKVVKDFVSKSADGKEFGPNGDDKRIWGKKNFWQRSEVIKALVNGTLIIEVRMRNPAVTACSVIIPKNPISKSILSMFNDEESADVLFEVDDEPIRPNDTRKRAKTVTTLYGHRLIMENCASNILGELCKTEESDNNFATNTVAITDVTPEIFKHLLYYIYGGEVSDENMKENAKDIIDAADKYGIVGLKLEAEASLVNSTTITFENAIENLLYADGKNCALMKEAVMDFIYDNRKEAMGELSFDNVPGSAMKDLLAAVNRGEEKGNNNLSTMRVNALRKRLQEKGLDIDGSREIMIARLETSR